jgi:hypothetical protein
MSLVFPFCLMTPLTVNCKFRLLTSAIRSFGIKSLMGQDVSNPFGFKFRRHTKETRIQKSIKLKLPFARSQG